VEVGIQLLSVLSIFSPVAFLSFSEFGKRRLDLPLEDCSQIERFPSLETVGRKHKVLWPRVMVLGLPFQQGLFEHRVHGQQSGRCVFVAFKCPARRQ
jgi:hypothetical protein